MVSAARREGLESPAERARPSIPFLLFVLLGPPVAWSLHFALLYFFVAAACAVGSGNILLPVAVATLVAGGVSAAAGVAARRRMPTSLTEGVGEGGGSGSLVLTMGVLGAAFFTLLILVEALPPLFLPICPPGES